MQFRKGDKIRFLNETGEGVVTKLMGNGMVMVETTEGFEYPYPMAQLVPVEPIQKEIKPEPLPEKQQPIRQRSASEPLNTRFPDGIYIAIIPQHQGFPSAGKMDMHLFNHSDYDIYYTLSIKDGRQWICLESGALRPRAETLIETLTPQQLDEWGQLKTDLLFFSGDAYEHRAPVSQLTRLNGVKFFKDTTFQPHALTGNKAWVEEISLLEEAPVSREESKPLTNDDIRRLLIEKEKRTTAKKTSVPAQKNQALSKEVDLHIEELLDNWNGMSNAQLLDVQLKRVMQEMDEAIASHLRSIVFIHGIGNGRLKQEVRKVLSTYKNVRFHDASFQRYGFGATEVEIF